MNYIIIIMLFISCDSGSQDVKSIVDKGLEELSNGNSSNLLFFAENSILYKSIDLPDDLLQKDYEFSYVRKERIGDDFKLVYNINNDTIKFTIVSNGKSFFIPDEDILQVFIEELGFRILISEQLLSLGKEEISNLWLDGYKSNESSELDKTSILLTYTDIDERTDYYRNRAEQGDVNAMVELAIIYDNVQYTPETKIPKDYSPKIALNWYEKAAKHNDHYSIMRLGEIYLKGQNFPKDYVKALQWFKKLNQLDVNLGLLDLGEIYLKGYGVKKDVKKANEYYQKAFQLGKSNANLAFNIAGCYKIGNKGIKKNEIKAIEWYEIADRLGCTNAKLYKELLENEGH